MCHTGFERSKETLEDDHYSEESTGVLENYVDAMPSSIHRLEVRDQQQADTFHRYRHAAGFP